MKLLDAIKNRYNAGEFSGESVDASILERILEAGRRAPSAKNRQVWRFIVIEDKKIKGEIRNACYGYEAVGTAGVILALCTTNVDYKMPNGQYSYAMDISFAASFMILQATHEGLGTGILTTYDEEKIKHILTVPYSMRIVLILLMGYPTDRHETTERLPVERIVSFNHW